MNVVNLATLCSSFNMAQLSFGCFFRFYCAFKAINVTFRPIEQNAILRRLISRSQRCYNSGAGTLDSQGCELLVASHQPARECVATLIELQRNPGELRYEEFMFG